MTLQSLAKEITATKQRLAGDYKHLKASPTSRQEAGFVWDALQVAAKKEILLMVCRQPNTKSVSHALWATLSYRGCKPSDWAVFLSALQEHLDDQAKCAVDSFLARGRMAPVNPTVRERFWADLMVHMRNAENNPAHQNLVWQAYCADKMSYFEPAGAECLSSVYSGFLAGQFISSDPQANWGNQIVVKPGATAQLVGWLSPTVPKNAYSDQVTCWQGRLMPAMSVRFSIDDSEHIRATPRTREVSFAVWQESPRVTFEVLAPRKPGPHTVWIEVFENNRKLSSLPLDLEVRE